MLAGIDLSSCELVVPSAREAHGDIQSRHSAVHAAGARTAITSLWQVDDRAPRARLGLFCENLLGDQMPKAEALWEAKQELRRGEFEKSDWAAWVLSGDPE